MVKGGYGKEGRAMNERRVREREYGNWKINLLFTQVQKRMSNGKKKREK